MKRFFIMTLLCVTSLNAGITKEEVLKKGFQENWKPNQEDLKLAFIDSIDQKHPLTIDKKHVPAHGFLPRGTEVYFPTADGSFEYGVYCSPDIQADKSGNTKIFWTTVVDKNDTCHSVATARLMIPTATTKIIAFRRKATCN